MQLSVFHGVVRKVSIVSELSQELPASLRLNGLISQVTWP